MWDCSEGSYNQYQYPGHNQHNEPGIVIGSSTDMDAGSMVEGFQLWSWDCNEYPQQVFYCSNSDDFFTENFCGTLKTSNGVCVEMSARDNGSPV